MDEVADAPMILPDTNGASGSPGAGAQAVAPRSVRVTEVQIAGPAAEADAGSLNRLGSEQVPARLYQPSGQAWATLVWAHGGSFIRGGLDWPEADWVSRRFAEAGVRVYSVDYVLASDQVKAPAPANDVAAVLSRVEAKHDGPVIVGGASAGAQLAVLAALDQADLAAAGTAEAQEGAALLRSPDAMILLYPTLHRVQRSDAAIEAKTKELPEARRFPADRIAQMYSYYLGSAGSGDTAGLVAGELPGQRLAQLPPTVIVNADADDLRASGEEFAQQLSAAGVSVSERVLPGTLHGYMNRPEESDLARADAYGTIELYVSELREILGVSAS